MTSKTDQRNEFVELQHSILKLCKVTSELNPNQNLWFPFNNLKKAIDHYQKRSKETLKRNN